MIYTCFSKEKKENTRHPLTIPASQSRTSFFYKNNLQIHFFTQGKAMVTCHVENADADEISVTGVLLSTVVPAKASGDEASHELSNMDLAMKLHYLRGVYLFESDVTEGLTVYDLKKPMFELLDAWQVASGRIRRPEGGRPVIRCNDGGVRFVEARCEKTVVEWVEMKRGRVEDGLVYGQVLGPDLGFSPLVYVQFTWFKCGGISVGLSWAHVLGDAFAASTFINKWAKILKGEPIPKSLGMPIFERAKFLTSIPKKPRSLKRVECVGDLWITTNNYQTDTYSFNVTARQLKELTQNSKIPSFEALVAVIWKCLAKISKDLRPKVVTICQRDSKDMENIFPTNAQTISVVEVDVSVAKATILELAALIVNSMVDERSMIEGLIEMDGGKLDFFVYGANLTFVNLENAEIYGLELKGKRPIFANYSVKGVGDEGVVLVFPGPKNNSDDDDNGRTVTITLPEKQLAQLKNELMVEWKFV